MMKVVRILVVPDGSHPEHSEEISLGDPVYKNSDFLVTDIQYYQVDKIVHIESRSSDKVIQSIREIHLGIRGWCDIVQENPDLY